MNEGPATPESFWQRSATRTAIGTTYALAVVGCHNLIDHLAGPGWAYAFDTLAAVWGTAFGINAISPIPKP